jgi:FMN reductase
MMPELIFYQHAAQMLISERIALCDGQRDHGEPGRDVLPAPLQHLVESLGKRPARRTLRLVKEKGLSKIVGISGSASPASRTRSIVEATLGRIAARTDGETHLISIADLVSDLGIAARGEASPRVEEALRLIETADLLIVGSPIYKGSYTGLLKHLIDLVDYRALSGIPVGLIATGGSDRHALVVEHHLRPLFGFFCAKTLATGVFITDTAIVDGEIVDAGLRDRLDQLTNEAVEALASVRERQTASAS